MTLPCLIRQKLVKATPEERVRQSLLNMMVNLLGYPKIGIAVEKSLSELPLVRKDRGPLPERRADIVCFVKRHEDLVPLLLVECKAAPFPIDADLNQLIGYNAFLEATFIALAYREAIKTGWWDSEKREYVFVDFLPTYAELLSSIE